MSAIVSENESIAFELKQIETLARTADGVNYTNYVNVTFKNEQKYKERNMRSNVYLQRGR